MRYKQDAKGKRQIVDALGLTPIHVNRRLKLLRQQRLIRIEGGGR